MKRGTSNFIAGLDIGSTVIRMAVGQFVEKDGGGPELQILGAAESESMGVHKGAINSIEDVVSSVSAALEKTERIVGVPIDSVWLGISGLHVLSQNSKGVVAVSKADSEISQEDVERALEAARAISTPL
ncbi:MAG TPA: cell division protein FtsA, partial [Patescibacteria group bacterium]|nr:cell division protein FtsA [Patescibacteria group bacterium]